MKRILFVDDEPRVLEGLNRMLYPLRKEWQMEFAASAQQALERLDQLEFDVLVTDLRMPQISGIQLLDQVMKRHPEVVRIVLSGAADREVTLPSVMLAHQYLDKPTDPSALRAAVERSSKLRTQLANPQLRQLISQIHSLPSVPALYTALVDAVQPPDAPSREVGRIMQQDVAMTAKILQLVHSSFLGVGRHINSAGEAVLCLGTNTVHELVSTVSVFSPFDSARIPGFSIEDLHDHALEMAALAREIAHLLCLPGPDVDAAYLGGFLHEIGKLVLAASCPEKYQQVLRLVQRESSPVRVAEREIFGASHPEVGGYVLSLWGLPDSLAEIVAHFDEFEPGGAPSPLLAVQMANRLLQPKTSTPGRFGFAGRLQRHLGGFDPLRDLAGSEISAC